MSDKIQANKPIKAPVRVKKGTHENYKSECCSLDNPVWNYVFYFIFLMTQLDIYTWNQKGNIFSDFSFHKEKKQKLIFAYDILMAVVKQVYEESYYKYGYHITRYHDFYPDFHEFIHDRIMKFYILLIF